MLKAIWKHFMSICHKSSGGIKIEKYESHINIKFQEIKNTNYEQNNRN